MDVGLRIVDLSLSADELNAAIDTARQEYIGFVEPDATYPSNYFDALMDELNKHPECMLVQGSQRSSNGERLLLEARFPKKTSVLDCRKEFEKALLYPCGILCRTEALRTNGVRFDVTFAILRDELFAISLCDTFPQRVFVPSQKYRSSRVFDESSPNTPQASQVIWYWESAEQLVERLPHRTDGSLTRSAQFALLYLTEQRFKSNADMNVKMVFEDAEQTWEYMTQVGRAMRLVEDDVLFSGCPATAWKRPKLLYLAQLRDPDIKLTYRLKHTEDDVKLYLRDSNAARPVCGFKTRSICIQSLEYRVDETGWPGLDVDLRTTGVYPADTYTLFLRNSFDGGETIVRPELTGRLGGTCAFFNFEAYIVPSYHVFIPLEQKATRQEISAFAEIEGKRIDLDVRIWTNWNSRLVENNRAAYWQIPGHIVRSVDGRVVVESVSRLGLMLAERRYQKWMKQDEKASKKMLEIRKCYMRTRRQYAHRRIWVYYDKGFKGGDNAEYAFRYAVKRDDGIEHVYFIGTDTVDGKRLIEEGYKVVDPYSMEGYLYALNAEVIFATHCPPYRKLGFSKQNLNYFKGVLDAKIIRMYHGFPITHDISYTRYYANYYACVVASVYETDVYTNSDHGFLSEQIITSSMPRYDGLQSDNHKQILFAPTWRPSARGEVSKNGESLYNPDFKNTVYYQRYVQIFSDERLLETARRCGYKIKLFLHPRLAPQTVDFKPNDVFEALDCTKDTDYVTIMRTSNLMITDYSSVMVDFAYMRKPVIYYQDGALPYWRYTDFDYEGIGFGEVCKDPNSLVETLCAYIETDCALKDQYRKRIDDFFYYDDFEGARRLYEALRERLG